MLTLLCLIFAVINFLLYLYFRKYDEPFMATVNFLIFIYTGACGAIGLICGGI